MDEGHLQLQLKELQELKNKLDLINACSPTRATKMKQKLLQKQLTKYEDILKKELRISDVEGFTF